MHLLHAIFYISSPSFHHYVYETMKLPNFTSPHYGVAEQNTNIVAFFLDNDRYGPKETFAKICQILMKLNKIGEV